MANGKWEIEKPKYLLTFGKGEMPRVQDKFPEIKNCVGSLVYFKENVGFHGARRPFRRGGGSNFYNGYIYEFRSDLLPDCIE